jgi:thiol:disulfide interchange protein DsbD
MKYITSTLLFVLIIFCLSIEGYSADNKHFNSVIKPSKIKIEPNEIFLIQLTVNMEKGWHIYGFEPKGISADALAPTWTEITLQKSNLWEFQSIKSASSPKIKYDSAFEMKVPAYYAKSEFILSVKALKQIDFSKDKLNIIFWAQQCTEEACLPPEEFKLKVGFETFTMTDDTSGQYNLAEDTLKANISNENIGQNRKDGGNKQEMTESQKQTSDIKKQGIWSYILFAMTQGALSLLTPCVFPMIPITVSFFTKRSEKRKSKGLKDSIVYALGIMFTFTGIGILFAAIYGPSGIQNLATNPWLNLGIAAIFIVFAMNLFGAFEIQLPTGILNKLNEKSQGSGILSVLLMGLTFSLTSFTCTVPFVGTTLVSVGSGEWFYPIIGMLAFSAVFAAPFFLLALFPSAMNKLPKAGGWMNNIKVIMGFLEIAAAIKFISNADLVWTWGIMPRELFLAIWIGCTSMIVLYILGIYKLHHDSPVESIGTPRILFSLFFVTITIWLVTGLFGKPLGELDAFLPPPDYEQLMNPGTSVTAVAGGIALSPAKQETKDNNGELQWLDNYQQGLKLAKEQNKKLFVDFTGFTCTNCRWMELNMFTKPEVSNLLSGMILVRLYTDRRNEPYLSNKQFQNDRFKSIELPLYVLYTPDEKLLGTKTFTRNQSEFINFLKEN